MLGARPSARGHVVIGEDFFQILPGSDGVRGKAGKLAHGDRRQHDRKIVCHDIRVSSGGTDSSGISL